MKKRIQNIIFLTTLAATLSVESAHAYIDPGSGSALITAILGGIGAVGYAVRKYYYKIKRFFGGSRDKDK